MQGKSLNGYPFRVETNVNAKVVGPNRELKQNIDKHNMATANLTEGVVKFLRGEFTESYISGLIPTIGNNFNVADQYIPAYMGMGVAGVSYSDDQQYLVVSNATGFAPSYADQSLISEILPMAKPGRAIVSKSTTSNGSLSQAASLLLSTAYHFEDQAESQTFSLEPSTELISNGTSYYLSDAIYPGRHIKQRIKSITPITDGWTYEEVTKTENGVYATGILYYTEPVKTRSNETLTKTVPALSVDLNTGVLTVIVDDFAFKTGLDITYDPVNFDFIYADGSANTVPFVRDSETFTRTYYVSELGLFSGDIGNKNSKLLARVMLDPETPLKISEGDYVLITWQIGVYALDDALYAADIETAEAEETSTLKFITQEEQTTLLWEEITDVDADGNVIEAEIAPVPNAIYSTRSVDFSNIDSGFVIITIDSIDPKTKQPVPADTLYKGFEANFSCLTGNLFGTITDIEYLKDDEYYKLTVQVTNNTVYIDNPFMCYTDQAILNTVISCNQQLSTAEGVTVPDITFTYKLLDVTQYGNRDFTSEHQDTSPAGRLEITSSVIKDTVCKFNPIYYLLGTEDIPASTPETKVNLDENNMMFYFLGRISELYAAGINDIIYEYSITQEIDTSKPVIFDTTEYRVRVELAVDPKTNQRGLIARCYKYDESKTNPYERVGEDNNFKIVFKNIYNPTIQKG